MISLEGGFIIAQKAEKVGGKRWNLCETWHFKKKGKKKEVEGGDIKKKAKNSYGEIKRGVLK